MYASSACDPAAGPNQVTSPPERLQRHHCSTATVMKPSALRANRRRHAGGGPALRSTDERCARPADDRAAGAGHVGPRACCGRRALPTPQGSASSALDRRPRRRRLPAPAARRQPPGRTPAAPVSASGASPAWAPRPPASAPRRRPRSAWLPRWRPCAWARPSAGLRGRVWRQVRLAGGGCKEGVARPTAAGCPPGRVAAGRLPQSRSRPGNERRTTRPPAPAAGAGRSSPGGKRASSPARRRAAARPRRCCRRRPCRRPPAAAPDRHGRPGACRGRRTSRRRAPHAEAACSIGGDRLGCSQTRRKVAAWPRSPAGCT
mmetsp:Transcript_75636/g.225466  ORF Transcript_75636/g.225466 Transcript_75636/m.225466 type:complete len:318 (-) Transcript_75636:1717-2670(-)